MARITPSRNRYRRRRDHQQEGYGWKVDQEQEIAKIAEEVDAHAADAREPQYAQREFAASTENNGFGKTYVEVDASRQHIWLYKDGNLVVEVTV